MVLNIKLNINDKSWILANRLRAFLQLRGYNMTTIFVIFVCSASIKHLYEPRSSPVTESCHSSLWLNSSVFSQQCIIYCDGFSKLFPSAQSVWPTHQLQMFILPQNGNKPLSFAFSQNVMNSVLINTFFFVVVCRRSSRNYNVDWALESGCVVRVDICLMLPLLTLMQVLV